MTVTRREIEAYLVAHVHDSAPRKRSKCDACDRRRLTTQVTLRTRTTGPGRPGPAGLRVIFLCRKCLVDARPRG